MYELVNVKEILNRPLIECPVCRRKMIVYKVRLTGGELAYRTIHECGVPKGYGETHGSS